MLLGFRPLLVPGLEARLSVACRISRGWGNSGLGRYLLKIQGALGVLVGGLVVSFCFLSWDVAISFARSLECGRGCLSGWDVGCSGVNCTAGS